MDRQVTYIRPRTRRRRRARLRWYLQGILLGTVVILGAWGIFRLFTPSAAAQADLPPSPPPVTTAPSPTQPSDAPLTNRDKLFRILQSDAYPACLKALAEKNPEALDFVYAYPQNKDLHPTIDLTAEASGTEIPYLLQWDTRWGYESYGGAMIADAGCGPTCLSMVALYLTKNAQWTPLAVARYAEEKGYRVDGAGSAWTLISEGCRGLGLRAEELPLSRGRMVAALDLGNPIIVCVGPGDFTTGGHYMVITGYTADGFTIHDPNSPEKSGKTWGYSVLEGQIRNLWAMSRG